MTTKSVVLFAIRLYQKTLSCDHGWFARFHPYGYCRFHPTCSMYAFEAVEKFGALKGGLMAVRRIFRCHPWARGGEDPVPSL